LGIKPKVIFKNPNIGLSKKVVIYTFIYLYRLYKKLESDLDLVIPSLDSLHKKISLHITDFRQCDKWIFYKAHFGDILQNFINEKYGVDDAESDVIMSRVGNILKIRNPQSPDSILNCELSLSLNTLVKLASIVQVLWTLLFLLQEFQDDNSTISLVFLILFSVYNAIDYEFISPSRQRKKFLVAALAYQETKGYLLPDFTESLRKINSDECLDLLHNS